MSCYKEYIEEGREHKACFGEYMDEEGNTCEEGRAGYCNYCTECREVCIYV